MVLVEAFDGVPQNNGEFENGEFSCQFNFTFSTLSGGRLLSRSFIDNVLPICCFVEFALFFKEIQRCEHLFAVYSHRFQLVAYVC